MSLGFFFAPNPTDFLLHTEHVNPRTVSQPGGRESWKGGELLCEICGLGEELWNVFVKVLRCLVQASGSVESLIGVQGSGIGEQVKMRDEGPGIRYQK